MITRQHLHNHHSDLKFIVQAINEHYLFLKTTWSLSRSNRSNYKAPYLDFKYDPNDQKGVIILHLPLLSDPWSCDFKISPTKIDQINHIWLRQTDELIKMYQLAANQNRQLLN